jgi:hypothetical protein
LALLIWRREAQIRQAGRISAVAAGAIAALGEFDDVNADCLYDGELHTDNVCSQADGEFRQGSETSAGL